VWRSGEFVVASCKMSKATIFIAVAGQIGLATLNHLDKNKFIIKVGVHSQEKADKLKEQGYDTVVIDFEKKKKKLRAAFKGVDRLFITPPSTETRGRQAARAIRQAVKVKVPYIALFSGAGAEEKRILFHKQFARAEKCLKKRASEVHYTILQAPFFQENLLAYKDGVYLPLRDGSIPACSVYDLGRTCAHVLSDPDSHNGKVYVLTGPKLETGESIAKALSEAQEDKEVKYVDVPPSEMKKALLGYKVPEWQADGILELMEDYANNRVKLTKDIKHLTGKKAKVCTKDCRGRI